MDAVESTPSHEPRSQANVTIRIEILKKPIPLTTFCLCSQRFVVRIAPAISDNKALTVLSQTLFARERTELYPPVGLPHPDSQPKTLGVTRKNRSQNQCCSTPSHGRHPLPRATGRGFHPVHRVTLVRRPVGRNRFLPFEDFVTWVAGSVQKLDSLGTWPTSGTRWYGLIIGL